jgi:uncharacterized protein with HEPN domain
MQEQRLDDWDNVPGVDWSNMSFMSERMIIGYGHVNNF